MINNKNIINIVETKRSGAQIPFSYYLPPDRIDKTPYADHKIDRTLLLLENQKRDYDLFKTDIIKSQMNNIKTITETINNNPNAELEKLTTLAMKYLPNEFNNQQEGAPQEREPYQIIDDAPVEDVESIEAEPQKTPIKTPIIRRTRRTTKPPKETPIKENMPVVDLNNLDDEDNNDNKFKCNICGRNDFRSMQGLANHKKAHIRQDALASLNLAPKPKNLKINNKV